MNILLVNDDGYNSEGITLIKAKLSKYGKVVIVAPFEQMSGKSFSINFGFSQKSQKMADDVYAFDGSPADCTAFGLSNLGIDFDLVVSGCNNGLNVANDVLHSGTIGACIMALNYHIKSIAVSCDGNFPIVDKYFEMLFDYVLMNDLLSNEYLLNVNFPRGEIVKDIRFAKLSFRTQYTYYINDRNSHIAQRSLNDPNEKKKTFDTYQVNHGIISITPLVPTIFNEKVYKSLKNKKI